MARVQEVVVDASVACKWFLPEKDTPKALLLRDDHIEERIRILAPELMAYEVANALRYHPALGKEGLQETIRYLYDLQLSWVPATHRDLGSAADFARRQRVSVYDACYATLAEHRSCPLVTDDTLLLKTSRRAVSLSEWAARR